MIRTLPWVMALAMLSSSLSLADEDEDLLAAPAAKKKAPPKAPKAPARRAAKKAPPPQSDDDLAAPAPAKATVLVKLSKEVKKAHLFIDERDMGTLPLEAQVVSPGEHLLQVKAPAHGTWTKKVNLGPGKKGDYVASLEATGALLSVSSDVAGADVFVNGRSVGSTPVEEAEVPAGTLEVVVKKSGYKDGTQTVKAEKGREVSAAVKLVAEETTTTVVAQNADRPENTNLTPAPTDTDTTNITTTTVSPEPIYKKWYFWAGAAAVVAAVAAGTAVGVSQANQSKALDEKAICGGKCDACIGFACSGLVSLPMGR